MTVCTEHDDCEVQEDGRHVQGPKLGTAAPQRNGRWATMFVAGVLLVLVAVGFVLTRGASEPKGNEESPVWLTPSPVPPVEYAEELSPRQERYYNERTDAIVGYVKEGNLESARELLTIPGLDGCDFGAAGLPYTPGDMDSEAGALYQQATVTKEANAGGYTVLRSEDIQIPPVVEPAYKGRYPNGKAYLKVVEQRAVIVAIARCEA